MKNTAFLTIDSGGSKTALILYDTNGSNLDRYVLTLSDLKFKKTNPANIAYFRVYFDIPKGKTVTYDQFEVKVGKDINKI